MIHHYTHWNGYSFKRLKLSYTLDLGTIIMDECQINYAERKQTVKGTYEIVPLI